MRNMCGTSSKPGAQVMSPRAVPIQNSSPLSARLRRANPISDPEATDVLLQDYRQQDEEHSEEDDRQKLTERETEVLVMTALGYSSREIGEMLFISPKTVDTYRQRSMDKLQLEIRADLVQYALKNGLLESK